MQDLTTDYLARIHHKLRRGPGLLFTPVKVYGRNAYFTANSVSVNPRSPYKIRIANNFLALSMLPW